MFLTDQIPTWPNSHDLTILFTWNSQFVSLREGGVRGGGIRALCPTAHLKNKYSWHQWKWIVTRKWWGAGRVLCCQVISLWHCCAPQYSATNLPNVAATLMAPPLSVRRAAISNLGPENKFFFVIYLSSSAKITISGVVKFLDDRREKERHPPLVEINSFKKS